MWERLVASFFLIGEAAPFAPATFASLAFLPAIYFYQTVPLAAQLAAVAVVTFVGVIVSTRAEPHYGHDGSAIVIDEVAGMLVTFVAVSRGVDGITDVWILLTGFLLFRIFDIWKPFPANRAQNLPTGTGVMTDDLIAGLYANLVLQVIGRWAGWFPEAL